MTKTNSIQIAPIALSDLEALKELGKETFLDSFSWGNTVENMKLYMNKAFADEQLSSEITNPCSEFYFALDNNRPVGYVKINFEEAQNELKGEQCLELERIYVRKAYQGNRVGQMLFDKVREIAEIRNMDFIWLGVWDKNPGAIRFYERNG